MENMIQFPNQNMEQKHQQKGSCCCVLFLPRSSVNSWKDAFSSPETHREESCYFQALSWGLQPLGSLATQPRSCLLLSTLGIWSLKLVTLLRSKACSTPNARCLRIPLLPQKNLVNNSTGDGTCQR